MKPTIKLEAEALLISKEITEFMYGVTLSSKLTHLSNPSKSYGIHYAIDTFVDEQLDNLDTFTECWMSELPENNLEGVTASTVTTDLIEYYTTVYNKIEELREKLQDKYQQSLIDNIQTSTKHLIYRLKHTV